MGNLKRRSAYDFASPAKPGSCGRPAPANVTGSWRCTVRCTAPINASSSVLDRNWISSKRKTTPRPHSAAALPIASKTSARSSLRLPVSA